MLILSLKVGEISRLDVELIQLYVKSYNAVVMTLEFYEEERRTDGNPKAIENVHRKYKFTI